MKKTITRIFAVAALFVAIGVGANAQNGRVSLGAELALPMGDFGDYQGIGFGLSLRYEHPVGDNIGIGLGAGYITFGGKDIDLGPFGTVEGESFAAIPIQGFFKYYFNEAQDGFYAMANVGVIMGKSGGEGAKSKTNLSYAPELGYHLANIDIGLRYQMFSQKTESFNPVTFEVTEETSTGSWIGLRIAYVFGEK